MSDMVPVFNVIAMSFDVKILSFNGVTIIEASLPAIGDNLPQGNRCKDPFTPEEAEALGLDLFCIADTGVGGNVSLGKELRDWRAFTSCDLSEIHYIDDKNLWLPDLQMSVWINPRISQVLNQINKTSTWTTIKMQGAEEGNSKCKTLKMFEAREMTPQDGQIKENWNEFTLSVSEGKNFKRISNFIPVPICREYRFNAAGESAIFYVIKVCIYGRSESFIKVPEEKLGALYKCVKTEVDSAAISHSKAGIWLESYVREHLAPLRPENDIKLLVSPGWQNINGTNVYILDGRGNFGEFQVDCGRRIMARNMSSHELWECFKRLIDVSVDISITAAMILFQFAGLLYSLFDDAGFRLQFALYIVGTTGSLKTSLAKVIFNVFDSGDSSRAHTFSDTPTAVEQYIGKLKDEVGLVDDLELGDDAAEEYRQKAIFNNIARFVGDSKGKNRSNPALQDVKATVTHGLVAMTGEQSLGKQSTRLRMVEVEVTKGNIIGERLAIFQQDKTLWGTVCATFIYYVERNHTSIRELIREQSINLRNEYRGKFSHLRTIDQLITFRLVGDILVHFWEAEGIQEAEITQTITTMMSSIGEMLINAASHDEIENPGIRFLLALDSIIGNQKGLMATDKEAFKGSTIAMGFCDEFGDMYILRDRSYSVVLEYMSKMHRRFAFDMNKVAKSLSELGAIESFANGQSRTFNIRIFGQTFIKLKGNRFKEIVEKSLA